MCECCCPFSPSQASVQCWHEITLSLWERETEKARGNASQFKNVPVLRKMKHLGLNRLTFWELHLFAEAIAISLISIRSQLW